MLLSTYERRMCMKERNLYGRGHCPSIFIVTSLPFKSMLKIMRMRPRAMKNDGRPRVLSPVYFVPPTMCHHLVRVMRDMTNLSSKLYCVIVLFSLCETETHPLVSNTCTTASTRTLTGNPSRESNNYWRLNLIVEIDTRKMQEVIWSKFHKILIIIRYAVEYYIHWNREILFV